MPTRAEMMLAPISRDSRIIEIGPSFAPLAPKADGWKSVVIDHTDKEGLVAAFAGLPNIDTNRIEPVDFVWTAGLLSDAVPVEQHGSFDAFVGSHVIEHTPDLIAFLNAAEILLKPEGVVILAVPDKRYCFDYFQPLTTTGQLLEAHAERRSRHTSRLAFDHFGYFVEDGGYLAWWQRPSQGLRLTHSLEAAAEQLAAFERSTTYVDLHAWRFVPASFELLLLELARLGETDWRIDSITDAQGCEFFTWLRRGGKARAALLSPDELAARRMALLKRELVEAQVQIDWLIAGEPELDQGETGRLRRHAEALAAELETARTERDAVLNSSTWRATEPFRRLAETAPAPVRRVLRRMLRGG